MDSNPALGLILNSDNILLTSGHFAIKELKVKISELTWMIPNNQSSNGEKEKPWDSTVWINKMAAGIVKSRVAMRSWLQLQEKSHGLPFPAWSHGMETWVSDAGPWPCSLIALPGAAVLWIGLRLDTLQCLLVFQRYTFSHSSLYLWCLCFHQILISSLSTALPLYAQIDF